MEQESRDLKKRQQLRDYLAAQPSYITTDGTVFFRKCLNVEHYERSCPLNQFLLAYNRSYRRPQECTNQDKKSTNGMHRELKTTDNLIALHQTPLFNLKRKTLDTAIQDINREMFNNIHSDLLIQMVLIPV